MRFCFLTVLALLQLAPEIAASNFANNVTIRPNLILHWNLKPETVQFMLQRIGSDSSWLGIGLSQKGYMVSPPSAAVVGTQGQVLQVSLSEMAVSGIAPLANPSILPGATFNVTATAAYLSFERPYKALDPADYDIARSGPVQFIYASGSTDGPSYHGPNNRGAFQLDLSGACLTSTAVGSDNSKTKTLHALTMLIGWSALVTTGVIIARYFRHHKLWIDLHMRLQTLGTAGTVSGVMVAMSMVQNQFASNHAIIGMFVAVFTALQAFFGNHVHTYRVISKVSVTEPSRIRLFAALHRNFGKVLTAIALYNVWLGSQLFLADSFLRLTLLIYLCFIGGLIATFEIHLQWRLRFARQSQQSTLERFAGTLSAQITKQGDSKDATVTTNPMYTGLAAAQRSQLEIVLEAYHSANTRFRLSNDVTNAVQNALAIDKQITYHIRGGLSTDPIERPFHDTKAIAHALAYLWQFEDGRKKLRAAKLGGGYEVFAKFYELARTMLLVLHDPAGQRTVYPLNAVQSQSPLSSDKKDDAGGSLLSKLAQTAAQGSGFVSSSSMPGSQLAEIGLKARTNSIKRDLHSALQLIVLDDDLGSIVTGYNPFNTAVAGSNTVECICPFIVLKGSVCVAVYARTPKGRSLVMRRTVHKGDGWLYEYCGFEQVVEEVMCNTEVIIMDLQAYRRFADPTYRGYGRGRCARIVQTIDQCTLM